MRSGRARIRVLFSVNFTISVAYETLDWVQADRIDFLYVLNISVNISNDLVEIFHNISQYRKSWRKDSIILNINNNIYNSEF